MKRLDEIFDIKYGNSLELINCDEDNDGVPFISRTSSNNGMVARVKILDDVEPMPEHAITVALGGSVLASFYQSEKYYTGFHIYCLYPKIKLTEAEMIFYCAVIEENKYRYSYGRQANKTLKDILVPSIEDIPADLKSFSAAIPFIEKPLLDKKIELNVISWQWFRLDYLFEITASKDDNLVDSIDGNTPYVSSSQNDNGVNCFIDTFPSQESNTITVARIGSVGATFYHSYSYCVSSDNVRIFKPKFILNAFIGMFLITLIEKEKYRFAYGRTFSTKRMKELKIKLPVTPSDTPDWQFMEDYIKSLPFSANL